MQVYSFLMDGRMRVSTRAPSLEVAKERLARWNPDALEFLGAEDSAPSGNGYQRFETMITLSQKAPSRAPIVDYADAINQALR